MADELTKLRRENKELRAELDRKSEELDVLKRAISEGQLVPLSEYEELADLTGTLTDKHVSAACRQRRGPRSKTITANEKAEFIRHAYTAAIATDVAEMEAREQANRAAGDKYGEKPGRAGGHYSERTLREIIKSK